MLKSQPFLFMSAAICAFALLPFTAADTPQHGSFHPPPGILVAGLRESATHRNAIPALRITSNYGGPVSVYFWLHIGLSGQVLDVRDIRFEGYWHPLFDSNELIQAVRKVRYATFMQDGNAVEAWAQDTVELLARQDESPISQSTVNTVTAFPEPIPSIDFSITLSRSRCYGSCPSYSITVRGDGTVEYNGSWYVSIKGKHTVHIGPDAAGKLLDRFRAAHFFILKDEYASNVTDNPTYRLEVVVGNKKKTITDYVGAWDGMPGIVTELEDAVDETADSARWVTASPQTLAAMHEAGISSSSKEAAQILRRAVFYGNPVSVRALLAAGVPTSQKTEPEEMGERWRPSGSLLEYAAYYRQDSRKEVLAALLESPELRADKQGIQGALGKAAAKGNLDVARMLIAAGADPQALFNRSYHDEKAADQTYLMRSVESGVWAMIDDALSRPYDIHAIDRQGRSALGILIWTSPPDEDIFPIVDKLIFAGAGKKELDRALIDACDRPDWRDGLILRGADPKLCTAKK